MTLLYHNPACSTSRNVLAILRAAGEDPVVVDYLKTGWSEAQLRRLFADAGLTAREALRLKGPLAAEAGLTGTDIPEDRIIAAMIAHPALVERPFVVSAKGTALCRPAARVAALLAHLPAGPVLAPDGKVIFDPSTYR